MEKIPEPPSKEFLNMRKLLESVRQFNDCSEYELENLSKYIEKVKVEIKKKIE